MAVNIKDLFNVQLTQALAASPDKAKAIGGTYGLNISGEGGGNWKIDLASATPTVAESATEITDAAVVIGVAESDFQTLVADPGAGMKLFFAGKLKVKGNQMLAMKLKDLFALR